MPDEARMADISQAIDAIEALGPDVAWSLGIITNDRYVSGGRGMSVTINGATATSPPKPITIFEKGVTFERAAARAIRRYRMREAGDDYA